MKRAAISGVIIVRRCRVRWMVPDKQEVLSCKSAHLQMRWEIVVVVYTYKTLEHDLLGRSVRSQDFVGDLVNTGSKYVVAEPTLISGG